MDFFFFMKVFDFIGGGELFSYLRKVKYFNSDTGETMHKFLSITKY